MSIKEYIDKLYTYAIAYGYVGDFNTFSKSKYLDYVRASTALLLDFGSYDEWLSFPAPNWASLQ